MSQFEQKAGRRNGLAGDSMSVRLARYAAAMGAGSATAGLGSSASSLEVHLDNLGIQVNQFGSQPLDFLLDGDADLLLKNYVFGQGNYQGAAGIYAGSAIAGFVDPVSNFGYVSLLNAGDPINESTPGIGDVGKLVFGSMAYGSANPNAQWNNVTGGYLGLKFPDEAGTVTYYGWVRLDIDNTNGLMFIDAAFASNNSNGIVAGQVSTTGDYNGSGSVEQGDLDLVLNNWGRNTDPVASGGTGVPTGWLNNLPLGSVDQAELDLVLNNWGASSAPALQGVSVPEPGSLGLLAAGAAGLLRWRGRRHDAC